jgi:hypothetical protein
VLEIALNLSWNQLSGEIPAEFASFESSTTSGSWISLTSHKTHNQLSGDLRYLALADLQLCEGLKVTQREGLPKPQRLGLGFLKSARAVASNFDFRMNESDDL